MLLERKTPPQKASTKALINVSHWFGFSVMYFMKKIWIQKALSLKSLAAQHWLQTAWCVVGLKKPRLKNTNRHTTQCALVRALDMFSRLYTTHLDMYTCKIVCKISTKSAHTCTLISDAHEYIQLSDYSWDVHGSTPTCMHLISHCMPRTQKVINICLHTECTHTCTH